MDMKLTRIEIEPAEDGGFQIEAYYEAPPKEGKDQSCCGPSDRKRFVATDKAGLMEKINKLLGGKNALKEFFSTR